MPHSQSQDYDQIYEDFKASTKESACERLDELRETLVKLDQTKNTYWRRPCLRDWPCLFQQHRTGIDKIEESLEPTLRRLTRECELEMNKKLIKEASESVVKSTSNSNAHVGDSYHYDQNVHIRSPKA